MGKTVTFSDVKAFAQDERNTLLRGQFDLLPEILERKEKVLAALASGALSIGREDALGLRAQLAENQDISAASLSGIKTAKEKLERIREVIETMRFYGKNGSFSKGAKELIERKF